MVLELGLSNYDTALDSIDYSVPYEKIEWAWKSDAEAAKRREIAITELKKANVNYYPFRS